MIKSHSGKSGIAVFDLTGKTAIVTGAGRGIGQSIALALASAGAELVIASRKTSSLETTAQIIEDNGGKVHVAEVDISDPDRCEALIEHAQKQSSRVDIVVCNAATNIQGPAAEMAIEDWRKVIDNEMSGYYFLSRAAYPAFVKSGGGALIYVSANSSIVGYADLIGVATAKGGLDMMARNLAVEWGPEKIRVNTINPGWTDHVPEDGADVSAGEGDLEDDIRATTPLQRRGRMDEFGYPAVFLASDAASYITGQNLVIDGGYSVK